MKNIITFFLIIATSQVFSQSKWNIGAGASLDYCYRFNEKGNDIFFMDGSTLNDYEKAGLGYTLGLKVKYDFTKHFSILSGIGFWQNNYQSRKIYLEKAVPNDPNVPDNFYWSYKKEYLQVPLLASFYLGNKIKFGVTTGFALNFSTFQERKEYAEFNNGTLRSYTKNELDKSGNNLLFTSGIIGLGAAYNYKKMQFILEPTFNCKLFDISPKTELYLWNAGLNLSVFYKL
ncbi:MAG: outer membrane beta-barrel protein [Bacteroidia bacterium]